MNKAAAYKSINYKDLQPILWKKFADDAGDDHNAHFMRIALKIEKTAVTVRNCFQPMKQVVSDEIFTKVMVHLNINGKVEWFNGERKYYISKN